MELQNVLQQRRSIRKYKQQPVEKRKNWRNDTSCCFC